MTVTRLVVLGGDMRGARSSPGSDRCRAVARRPAGRRGEDLVGDVGLPTLLQPAEMVRAESGEHRKLLPT